MPDDMMKGVYRHDAHKLRGRSHDSNSNRLAGVTVNLDVPYGADADAAAMSRPRGKPSMTVDGHDTHYRLSLLTGKSRYDPHDFSLNAKQDAIGRLLTIDDAEDMHAAWLESDLASGFNEAVHYPYTSLKYHTLIVASLVHAYRNDHGFDDLYLTVDNSDKRYAHQTIYSGDGFSLRIAPDPDGACARLGSRPARSFSGTWQRLTAHPLSTMSNRWEMQLDAHLRRVRSWSTALQFIEDYQRWRPDT